ncbi:MAG: peptide chain release factor N(5)-glutamine methyltransferase [Culicoidibacterales bacterium]
MKITDVLKQAENQCLAKDMSEHPARLLLMHILEMESYQLFSNLEEEMDEAKRLDYFTQLGRYTDNNEPIQYIIGYEYFAGRNLIVTPGALIPRPETEELVHEILFLLDDHFSVELGYDKINVVDIGTGSGAIAISIAAEEPRVQMSASDISVEALEVTKLNAQKFDITLNLYQGDMVKPLIKAGVKVDVLISNPPYIPAEEEIESIVKENEPHVALFGGSDGLQFYKAILGDAKQILNERYLLAFEIGYDQGTRLLEIAKTEFPEAKIYLKQDMQQKDRMLFIHNF